MAIEQTEASYTSGQQFSEQVLSTLQKNRIKPDAEQHLNFFLYLPTEEAAEECANQIRLQLKLEASVDQGEHDTLPWLVWTVGDFVPTPDRLVLIGDLMIAQAQQHGGDFDGWDTVKKPTGWKIALFLLWGLIKLPFVIVYGIYRIVTGCILPGQKVLKGFKLLEAGKYDKARAIAQSLLKHPQYADGALHLLGHVEMKDENYPAAEQAFREAIKVEEESEEPESLEEAYLNLGTALEHQQRYDEAMGCYTKALELKENYPTAYYNIANIYIHYQDREQVRTYLQYAIYLRPSFLEQAREDEDFSGFLTEEDFAFVATPPAT